jgi:hypothetical protein
MDAQWQRYTNFIKLKQTLDPCRDAVQMSGFQLILSCQPSWVQVPVLTHFAWSFSAYYFNSVPFLPHLQETISHRVYLKVISEIGEFMFAKFSDGAWQ